MYPKSTPGLVFLHQRICGTWVGVSSCIFLRVAKGMPQKCSHGKDDWYYRKSAFPRNQPNKGVSCFSLPGHPQEVWKSKFLLTMSSPILRQSAPHRSLSTSCKLPCGVEMNWVQTPRVECTVVVFFPLPRKNAPESMVDFWARPCDIGKA